MSMVAAARKWTEEQFRVAVAKSDSIAQVIRKLGLAVAGGSYKTVGHYITVWNLDISHFVGRAWVGTRPGPVPGQRYTLETIFCEDSTYWSSDLLRIILREGYRERRCESCGLDEWLGQPIAIEVDHINGKHNDHRLSNLRLLCPNCHAQTSTWRGRANRKPRTPKVPKIRTVRTAEQVHAYQREWYARRRDEWLAANGPCRACGSSEDLTVTYIDPATSVRSVSAIWGRSAAVREAELAKCQVLCGSCRKTHQRNARQHSAA
jgi:5-methylcytosine-specific restriction endonuclease McrA